jgi:hypothetical protein
MTSSKVSRDLLVSRGRRFQKSIIDPIRTIHGRNPPFYWEFSPGYPCFPEGVPDDWNPGELQECKAALDAGQVTLIPFVSQHRTHGPRILLPMTPQMIAEVSTEAVHPDYTNEYFSPHGKSPVVAEPEIVELITLARSAIEQSEPQQPERVEEVSSAQTIPEPSAATQDEVGSVSRDNLVLSLRRKLQEAKMTANNYSAEISSLKTDLAASSHRFETTEAHLQRALQIKTHHYSTDVSALKADLVSSNDRVQAAESQLETAVQEKSDLQAYLQRAYEDYRAKIVRLETKIRGSEENAQVANSVMEAQSTEITRLKTELEEAKARTSTAELEQAKAEKMQTERVLAAQSNEIMRQRAELEEVKARTTRRIYELEAQLQQATSRVGGLRLAVQENSQQARERFEAQLVETTRLQTWLREAATKISELEARVEERQSEISGLHLVAKENSEEARFRLAAQTKEVMRLKSELEDVQTQSGARISELEAQIEQKQNEVIGLRQDVANSSTKASELEWQFLESKKEVRGLRREAASTGTRMVELVLQLQQNENETSDLRQKASNTCTKPSELVTQLQESKKMVHLLHKEAMREARDLPGRLQKARQEGEDAARQHGVVKPAVSAHLRDSRQEGEARQIAMVELALKSKSEQHARDALVRSHGEQLRKTRTVAYDEGFKAGWALLYDSLEENPTEVDSSETETCRPGADTTEIGVRRPSMLYLKSSKLISIQRGFRAEIRKNWNISYFDLISHLNLGDGVLGCRTLHLLASMSEKTTEDAAAKLLMEESRRRFEAEQADSKQEHDKQWTIFPKVTIADIRNALERLEEKEKFAELPPSSVPSNREPDFEEHERRSSTPATSPETVDCSPTPAQTPLPDEPLTSPEPTPANKRRRSTSPLSDCSSVPNPEDEDTIVVEVDERWNRNCMWAVASDNMYEVTPEPTRKRKRGRPSKRGR